VVWLCISSSLCFLYSSDVAISPGISIIIVLTDYSNCGRYRLYSSAKLAENANKMIVPSAVANVYAFILFILFLVTLSHHVTYTFCPSFQELYPRIQHRHCYQKQRSEFSLLLSKKVDLEVPFT
jgi:hypothetical protein